MSGSLNFAPRQPPPGPHDHFDLVTTRGTLRLHDPRRFGAVVFARSEADPVATKLLAHLGMEPLEPTFDVKSFGEGLARRKAPIKQVLLAGDVVVGVGNIYASEALFMAGIRPTTAANRLSKPRQAKLHAAIREVLARAVQQGGSTLRDFSNAQGGTGYFQLEAMVYGREGAALPGLCQPDTGASPRPALHVFLFHLPETLSSCRAGDAILKDSTGGRLATSFNDQFDQHGTWRREFALRLKLLGEWMKDHELLDSGVEERLRRLETQVRSDKVMVAFVAEFSRGKSEMINALFFAGYGRRIMPASAGRTTMCPTEMGYDADVPPCLRLLPIETRLQPQALMEWRMAPEKWTRIDLDVNNPKQLAQALGKGGRNPQGHPGRGPRTWVFGTARPQKTTPCKMRRAWWRCPSGATP